MATLRLVCFEDGSYALQGTSDPSQNADFSLFDTDGEGGDPFVFANVEWEIVQGVDSAEYDPEDTDTFWEAREAVLGSARSQRIRDNNDPNLHRDGCSCGDERCWVWQKSHATCDDFG